MCFILCEGVSIPRQANDGSFLPSARDISLAVHKDVDNPHLHLTAMAAIWGQLVHNDISHTPQMAGKFSLLLLLLLFLVVLFYFLREKNHVHVRHAAFYHWNFLFQLSKLAASEILFDVENNLHTCIPNRLETIVTSSLILFSMEIFSICIGGFTVN